MAYKGYLALVFTAVAPTDMYVAAFPVVACAASYAANWGEGGLGAMHRWKMSCVEELNLQYF